MPRIDVNLDAVADYSGELHPDGPTLVRIKKAEVKLNKAKDGKYINWQLEAVDSDIKTPLWLMTSLKVDNLWALKAFLKTAKVQWDTDGSFDLEETFGAELYVTVSQDEYEGKMRNTVGLPYESA
jgi:hypothetical protein